MKQFDLEEYLKNSNQKVVTRDGRPVRIICTDRYKVEDYPVVALIYDLEQEKELCVTYSSKGEFDKNANSDSDLFFTPTKHEGWVNVFRDGSGSGYKYAVIFNSEQEARNDVVENERCGYITTTKIEWEE